MRLLPSVGSELINILSCDKECVNIDLMLNFLTREKLECSNHGIEAQSIRGLRTGTLNLAVLDHNLDVRISVNTVDLDILLKLNSCLLNCIVAAHCGRIVDSEDNIDIRVSNQCRSNSVQGLLTISPAINFLYDLIICACFVKCCEESSIAACAGSSTR